MLTIENRSLDPFYNQAFEEFVFQSFTEEDFFFVWQNRPAVVVGSFQNICREVRVGMLRDLGIPIVRRISGGGTVYHDLGNLNYTYILRREGPLDYGRCLGPVITALNAIGVPARRDRVCDIAIGEQKISGSAQRSAGDRVLHHGTLLFDSDLDMLDRITTAGKNLCFQTKGTASAICPVTNIRPHLAEDMPLEAFRSRLLESMGAVRYLTLTGEQEQAVRRLRDEKYRSWEWTWGRTPPFSYERTGTFAGSPIHVVYGARRGIISGASIDSPLIDGDRAAALLNGAPLDPEGLAGICRALAGDRAEELLDWLM